ncbi:urea ABC transporter permease subunit UrtB [Craurococcus roseus]|uniref:Urea ABC transporter permease subunit UrtB n=1 Tax=Craurococcus roseus TaxID=77585 RepID=A0ABN1FEM5_9PROT
MDLALAVGLQVLTGVAMLVIVSLGLAVVFGMMRVINLAHGEFMMLGAFAAVLASGAGLSLWVAMLVVAPVAVGLFGLVVERLLIRRLYGRMVDTMLATWGLSLALVGGMTMLVGNSVSGVSAPLGSVAIGGFRTSGYDLFLIGAAVALSLGVWAALRFTRWGLVARGTMQDAETASALGVAPDRVYAATFVAGAALSGLAGALLAPLSGVVPTMGAAYIARAFITVITGGAAILAGTLSASGLLGTVSTLGTFLSTPVLGEVAMLAVAIVLLRLLPRGITGRVFRRAL